MTFQPKRAALRASTNGPPPPPESQRRWLPANWTDLDSVRLAVAETSILRQMQVLAAEMIELVDAKDLNSARIAEIQASLRKCQIDHRKLSGFDKSFNEAIILDILPALKDGDSYGVRRCFAGSLRALAGGT